MKDLIKIKNQILNFIRETIKNYLVIAGLIFVSCDTIYQYDMDNAYDDYTSESSEVTAGELTGIDVSQYHNARIFPGLVDTLVDRHLTDTIIMLDMRLHHVSAAKLLSKYVPEPIYSTGLYAGAGEKITITVDGNVNGLVVQIGSHSNQLPATVTSRTNIIHTRQALFPGENTLRNPFGGYIWIIRNNNVSGANDILPLTISGAYQAPDFVKGITDPKHWVQQIRSTTVPWLELRSDRVAFSVPRTRMEEMLTNTDRFAERINDVLALWDFTLENFYYTYFGMTRHAAEDLFRMPDYPERVVLDVQLPGDLLISWGGQPVMAINSAYMINELINPNIVMGGMSAAVATSFANNYAMSRSPFWSVISAAASQIPMYRMAEKGFVEGSISSLPAIFAEDNDINIQFPEALSFVEADSGKIRVNNSAYDLLFFIHIAHYNNNNWKFYEEMMRNIRETSAGMGGASLAANSKTFFTYLCDYFELNFAPFFDRYGFVIPDRTRTIIDNKYPLINRTMWRYNPLSPTPDQLVTTWDGAGYRYFTDRTDWNGWGLDANLTDNWDQSNNRPVSRIIDGDIGTFWHSEWNTNFGGARPVPHYVVFDLKQETKIDGFYIATGTGSGMQVARRVIFEILENQFEDLDNYFIYDPSLPWVEKACIRPRYPITGTVDGQSVVLYPGETWQPGDGVKENDGLPQYVSPVNQYFDFDNRITARYIRLKMPETSGGVPTGIGNNSLSEFGTYIYKL